ncbi:MAG: Nickel-dependent lactate racemase, partial [Candidatus Hydrogenedentes bacterium]|nr:Nickel-dependent lactate racemase [Candidatus Hydrogenedentota bacterium]
MRITMPYGDTVCDAEIAWGKCLGTLDIRDMPELPDIEGAVREALEHPIGLDRPLAALVSPGETVAILVSDAFRHTGVDRTLPVILAVLNKAGIPDSAITIVFATGTHRPPTLDEQARILGPELDARMTKRIVHDPENMFNFDYVGKTSRGTRVELNKAVMAHDRIVATGAVVLHYFAGYGGGRKSVVPGIASAETIAHNHAMNLDPHEDRLNPNVRIGALEGNPVAEDMLEAARFAQVDCIVNTVLNRQGQIAGVFAGELDAAHRAAAQFARGLFAVDIKERADLVIASAGSAKNFVQCHKALFNAYQAVFPAGRIVFVAQCPEGLGG